MMMNLIKLSDEIYEVNLANGWYEKDRAMHEDRLLLHSEVSEAFEAYRSHGFSDFTTIRVSVEPLPPSIEAVLERVLGSGEIRTWQGNAIVRSAPIAGPDDMATLAAAGLAKPEGVGSELADVLIRLIDTAKRRDWAIPDYFEVPPLSPKADFLEELDEMHAHIERSSTVQSLLVVIMRAALIAGVDLDYEVKRKIAYNRTRGYRHGGKRL